MENPEKKVPLKSFNYIQWVTVLSAFIIILQLGLFVGWASPNFAWLKLDESPVHADDSDISWIASCTALGSAVGAILGSICMEHLGSRKTLLLSCLVIGISWSCFFVATSIAWFYVSRTIGAAACFMMQGAFSMYLGEISSPGIRGALVSLALTGSPVGTILSTVAETYFSKIEVSSSLYLAAAIVGIMLMFWLRDTPYYFLNKNDVECATKSIQFYHADKETEKELQEIKSFVQQRGSQKLKDRICELRSPVIKRSMLSIFVIWGLPYLCGHGVLAAYMEIILKSAKFDLIKPHELVIYTTVVKAIVAFIVVKLIDKIGRKFLLTVGSVGTSVSMFALGLHFYLLSEGFDSKSLQWLPFASIMMHSVAYAAGFSTVPGTVLSEMFPEKVKSTAVFVASMSGPIFGFIITKIYQPIIDIAGEEYAFWVYSLLSLLGIPCAVFLMIETKGKSFQEIQDQLTKKWDR